MLKKMLAILLVVVLVLSMAACGGDSSKDAPAADAPATETPAAETPAADTPAADTAAEDNPPVTLSFANYLPAGNPMEDYVINPLIEELKAVNITIDYYAAGTLAGGDQLLDAVIEGTADIGVLAVAYFVGRLPYSFLFEYPIPFASAEAASWTMKQTMDQVEMKELDDFHVILPFCSGPGSWISTKPVKTAADVKGMQIRTNAIQGELVTALGGVPVTMPISETYDALRSGIVDAQLGNRDVGFTMKLYEVAPNLTLYPFSNNAFYIAMNNEKYNSLTDAQKQAIDAAGEKVFAESAAAYQGKTGFTTIDAINDGPGELIELPQAEVDIMAKAAGPVIQAYVEKINGEGYDGTAVRELIEKLATENSAKYPENTR